MENLEKKKLVESTAASALTESPDELSGIMHEVLKYQQELTLTGKQDGKRSTAMFGAGGKRLPQDGHSTLAELELDGSPKVSA